MAVFAELTLQDFHLDGKVYKYWIQGNSNNPPLVMFYGFTGVAKDFSEVTNLLKDKYLIVIPEFPGWNGSPRLQASLSLKNYAKFFKQLFNFLGYSKVSIFGHCLGAVEAIEFTYLYPETVDKLILVSTPYLGSKTEKFHKILVRLAERSPKQLRPIFFFWRSRIFGIPFDFYSIKLRNFEKKLDRIKEHIFKQPHEPQDAVEENWISFIKFDFRKARKIKQMVHLIHGAEDVLINPRQAVKLQTLFPRVSLDIIPEAGHVPPVETTKELVKLLRRYLD